MKCIRSLLTIVVNTSTCKGIEPLKLAFPALVMIFNQPTIITSKKMQKENPLQLEFRKVFALQNNHQI
jgi:hypothetical protein